MDAALTLVLGFVQGIAAQEPATTPDAEWWERVGPLLAELVTAEDYPLAVARRHGGRRSAGRPLRRGARLRVRARAGSSKG